MVLGMLQGVHDPVQGAPILAGFRIIERKKAIRNVNKNGKGFPIEELILNIFASVLQKTHK